MQHQNGNRLTKLSLAGVIVSLGIVFGDIGTSPLYVLKAIISAGSSLDELLIIGSLSCIIWTLTLQTTIKYVVITLRADNKGEGGIFSLFALLRKRRAWLFMFAIVGGSTLLADGIITPAITVMSSIEGLALIRPSIPVIPIVLIIFAFLFFIQQFGTSFVGKSFGPIMFVWFTMLGILGLHALIENPIVLKAFNPYYVFLLLSKYPGGFLLLGAVFLCTTGAEALYADLGHCGLKNIRISWFFVKITLIVNYLGQGAWVLKNASIIKPGINPFYAIIPHWFLPFGIAMAAVAAIIASQALISGSFTLISEAVSLNFWPKNRIKYPSHSKGQMYIPLVNWFLFISCCIVVLLFQNSSNMEAAYGLSITITMLMTTLLVAFFLRSKRIPNYLIFFFATIYLIIEGVFLIANLDKFSHGGWFTILVGSILSLIMFSMYQGRKVRNRFISFHKVKPYLPIISDLSEDESIPKFAGNLVYTTHADYVSDLEAKTIDSLINRNPKRADHYWFLHVDIVDSPYMLEYKVTELWPGKVTRIDFYLGFKVQLRINEYFKQILKHLSDEGKIDLLSTHPSLRKHNILSEFKFVHIDRSVKKQAELGFFDSLSLNIYYRLKQWGLSDVSAYGLDSSQVTVEHIPLTLPTGKTKTPIIHRRV